MASECGLCPLHVLECAHYGGVALWLESGEKWNNHECFGRGPVAPFAYMVSGPHEIEPVPLAAPGRTCALFDGRWQVTAAAEFSGLPTFETDDIQAATAELHRREALLLGQEVPE